MFVNWGNLHPFTWHNDIKRIRPDVVYQLYRIDMVLQGEVFFTTPALISTVHLVDVKTKVSTALTITPYTYEVNGVELKSWRVINNPLAFTGIYYLKVTTNLFQEYYSDYVTFQNVCDKAILLIRNECSNTSNDWDNDNTYINIYLSGAQQDAIDFETEKETILTQLGEVQKTIRQRKVQQFKWVAPKGFWTMFNGAKESNDLLFNSRKIKNFDVQKNDINELYSEFLIQFEYDTLNYGDTCCDDLNLDDIADPDNPIGGDDCDDFEVQLNYSDNVLSATIIDPPAGTLVYRWFRNGVLISQATTIVTTQPGEYRLDVLVVGCRATHSISINDPCAIFSINVYSAGNFVNADLNNLPSCPDASTDISIVFDGAEVGTALPHEAAETGLYFVYAERCGCVKSGAVFVNADEIDCGFDLSIEKDELQLTAVADPSSGVTFNWFFTGANNIEVQIGTGATQNMTLTGVYRVEATKDEVCIKDQYYVYVREDCTPIRICNWDEMPGAYDLVEIIQGDDNFSYELNIIDLTLINNPEIQLTVKRNGVALVYEAGTPTDSGQYGISGSDILLWSDMPLMAGEVLIIRLNS